MDIRIVWFELVDDARQVGVDRIGADEVGLVGDVVTEGLGGRFYG